MNTDAKHKEVTDAFVRGSLEKLQTLANGFLDELDVVPDALDSAIEERDEAYTKIDAQTKDIEQLRDALKMIQANEWCMHEVWILAEQALAKQKETNRCMSPQPEGMIAWCDICNKDVTAEVTVHHHDIPTEEWTEHMDGNGGAHSWDWIPAQQKGRWECVMGCGKIPESELFDGAGCQRHWDKVHPSTSHRVDWKAAQPETPEDNDGKS